MVPVVQIFLMTAAGLRKLGEDVKLRGLRLPILLLDGEKWLLDDRPSALEGNRGRFAGLAGRAGGCSRT
jgi:hypothetical protein